MKPNTIPFRRIHMIWGVVLLAASCVPQAAVEKQGDRDASFTHVKPVLERNCVHCHASIRLPRMPSFSDTKALAELIGPNKLIVPGKPEQSRFYVVATLSDDQAGAMPPTGHAITAREAAKIREWIQVGAPLPDGNIEFEPVGIAPRSR